MVKHLLVYVILSQEEPLCSKNYLEIAFLGLSSWSRNCSSDYKIFRQYFAPISNSRRISKDVHKS